MKSQKNILLTALVSFGLASAGMPIHAQTFPNITANYYWQGGVNNLIDTPGNYNNKDMTATGAVNSARPLFFGYPGAIDTATISLNPTSATSVGKSYDVMTGDFTFDLNGNTNVATVLGTKAWTFGDGTGRTSSGGNGPAVFFTDSSENTNSINFGAITLGANGSANNVWGGPNATITFASNVTPVLLGNITVGDGSTGSTGNVFNGTAGQTYGGITLNAGTGNAVNLNGNTLTGGLIANGGTLTVTNGITVNSSGQGLIMGSGMNLTLSSGSSITSTGVSITSGDTTGVSVGTGSNLTVDGGTVSTQNAVMTGSITIQNGGQFSTNGGIGNTGLHDTLTGTLNITGAGSAFNGAVNHSTANFDGQDSMILATGSQISVTNGGSFTENADLDATTTANFNVDSSSSVNILGNLGANTAVNITGGGTVNAGSFATDGTVGINTGSGTLSVGTLTLTGTTIGDHGANLAVTNSLLVGNKSAMASGDTLQINGGVILSGVGGSQSLTINAGAVLSGQGSLSTSGANTGGFVLNGGTIRVGSDSTISGQTLSFNKTLIEGGVVAPTFEFSLYSDGTNDKLQLQFAAAGTSFENLNLKLNLVGDLADFQTNTNGDLTFTLFTDLSGNGIGEGSNSITLDSATVAAFAADGYTIDTSMLGTNGSITLDAAAVPEPSTWALLILGAGALIYFRRRQMVRIGFLTRS